LRELNDDEALPPIVLEVPDKITVLEAGVIEPLFVILPRILTVRLLNDRLLVELICISLKLNVPLPDKLALPSIIIFEIEPENVTPFATSSEFNNVISPPSVLVPVPDKLKL